MVAFMETISKAITQPEASQGSGGGSSCKRSYDIMENAPPTSHYFVNPRHSTSTLSLSINSHDSNDDDFEEGSFPVFDGPQKTKKKGDTETTHNKGCWNASCKAERTVSSNCDNGNKADCIIDLTL